MTRRCVSAWLVLAASLAHAPAVRAQTHIFTPDPLPAWPAGAVLAVRPDPADPARLILGGSFPAIGPVAASNIARLSPAGFTPIGTGFNADTNALAEFAGALVAGGDFTAAGALPISRVARWSGSSWDALGAGLTGDVFALLSADVGAGPGLVAAGQFTASGATPMIGVARWDGSAWSAMAGGLVGGAKVGLALASHDDGRGPAVFVGGSFLGAGTVPSTNVVRWAGGAWSAVGEGLNGPVRALTPFGGALIAGGDFTGVVGGGSASRLAAWDGAAWAEFAGGANGPVRTLAVLQDGPGPTLLIAGGDFTEIGGVSATRVAVFDGSAWTPLGDGSASSVRAVTQAGDRLYLGVIGTTPTGSPTPTLLRWALSPSGPLGDLNGDGRVNGADISVILSNWGAPGALGDLNNDGGIDGGDLAVILSNFTG